MFPGVVHAVRARLDAPSPHVQLRAVLSAWGFHELADAVRLEPGEVERHLDQLRDRHGEVRVEAARWLASRGVREAVPNLLSAMADPETLRPCQIAHALGTLGDDRAVPALAEASLQTENADLAVCATIALGEIGSGDAAGPLAQAARTGPARTHALEALGRIAAEDAVPVLRQAATSAATVGTREIARTALARLDAEARSDPLPGLVALVVDPASDDDIRWAVRRLARLGDPRAVPALAMRAFEGRAHPETVAALLVLGPEGRAALRRLAVTESKATRLARAALDLPALAPPPGAVADRR